MTRVYPARRRSAALAALSAACWLASAAANAQSSIPDEVARARLLAATEAVGDLKEIRLGLDIEMAPGWKTYWRSPGDAGLPPRLDWSGSVNLGAAEVRWPIPDRFSLFGLETFGYEDRVVFPILIRPAETGRAVGLKLFVEYLVCKEVCIPAEANLSLDLPQGAARPSEHAHAIDRFMVRVPGPATAVGLAIERLAFDGESEPPALIVEARAEPPLVAPDVLIEGPAGVAFGKPSLRRHATGVDFRVPVVAAPEGRLDGQTFTVTVTDNDRAIESRMLAVPSTPLGGAATWAALAAALLGGFILNFMPCVLPVLSIKLLSVVGHGGGARRETRLAFVASAAGIMSSFLLLAGLAIGFKATGAAVGWGVQFQQPLFLIFMVLVLTLFAANLWDLFHIALPAGIGALAERGTAARGLLGHFLSGAFATLLATPCSAPFLGTAVSFAFSRGPLEVVAIFAALGLGLSLPYLAVAQFPGLATRLPRPGPWTIHMKRILGLALIGTAVWLLSVLGTQIGTTGAAIVAGTMTAAVLTLALAALGRLPRVAAAGVVAGLALIAFVAPSTVAPLSAAQKSGGDSDVGRWQAFDRSQLSGLVADGRVVLVDVTADWCVTCQVNKRLVLNNGTVVQRLASLSALSLRADWTLPNRDIADYLASHGRYGIPFNVAYGPSAPRGIVLPELLTVDAMLSALDRAAAKP